jgi:hypothetical protein
MKGRSDDEELGCGGAFYHGASWNFFKANALLRFEWEWCQVPGSGYPVSGIRAIFILHHASCILHPYLNKVQ